MAFDFKKSLIKVQGGQQYLPVSARIVWFREVHPDWGIVTEPVEINHEKQYAVFRTTVFNAEGRIMATGTKKEDVKGFGDYVEKAETGSVGRALALCGFGTQFSPELDETGRGRLADSPYPMGGNRYGSGGYNNNNNYGGSGSNYSGGGGNRFPAPTREEPPARPAAEAPRRPAPAPSLPDEDDDFESLVSGDSPLTDREEDPFRAEGDGDEAPPAAPAHPSAAVPPAPVAAGSSPSGPPACVSCGKALTRAQQELSIRNYGEALCPACQKDKTRTGSPAMAQR